MFNIIKIIFEIYINNNEILKTKWEHDKKKKNWMSLVMRNKAEPKF
jgi:hypothetical protein